jgi:hypothetical protein
MAQSNPHDIISTFLHLTKEMPDRFQRLRRWSYGSVIVVIMLLTRPRRLCDYSSVFLTLKFDAPKLFGDKKTPAKSTFSDARGKVSIEVFRWLLEQVSKLAGRMRSPRLTRKSRRFFAVDGVNLVVPSSKELRQNCERPKYNSWLRAHYPQAKVLVAFDVLRRVPLEFTMLAKGIGERAGLSSLYQFFNARDVIIMDRGFPARWLLRELVEKKLDVVMRMTCKKCGSFPEVKDFIASGKRSCVLNMRLDKDTSITVRILRKNFRVGRPKRHQRVETMVVLTTLAVSEFSNEEIFELYGKRWGIETLFREMKHSFAIERFHARTLLGIQQEIAAILLWSGLASVIQIAVESKIPSNRSAMRTLCLEATDRIIIAILTGDDPGGMLGLLIIEIGRHAYTPQEDRSFPRECKRPWGRWAKKLKKRNHWYA